MSLVFAGELPRRIEACGVIAVVVIDRAGDAEALGAALHAGGIGAVELALRTPESMEALARLKRSLPGLLVGAGTVLTPAQVARVREAGADFAVAPGCNRRVLAAAAEAGLPFAPGIATPSDIEAAVEQGCNLLKFFPAEPSGGAAFLRSMAGPYAHLGLKYIPLGGIDERTAGAYLAEPSVAALGGSWIALRELIRARDWPAITGRAARAMELIRKNRPSP